MNNCIKSLTIFFLLLPCFTIAQQIHTVGPKETLFSIGRDYNIHPKEIASYNNIDLNVGLTIGQTIKIPLKKTMPPLAKTIKDTTANASLLNMDVKKRIPIYHTVLKKENLFQIRMQYNKVPMDSLKKWNNLTLDAVNEGMTLIVGFDYISGGKGQTVSSIDSSSLSSFDRNNKSNKQEEPKAKKVAGSSNDSIQLIESSKEFSKGGFFGAVYEKQISDKTKDHKEENGTIGVFKSTSGWNDGKYYCLYNSAPSGTIIKIINTNNQKYIYAKVLDVIPDINKNVGVLISISKAGATSLEISEEKFEGTIMH